MSHKYSSSAIVTLLFCLALVPSCGSDTDPVSAGTAGTVETPLSGAGGGGAAAGATMIAGGDGGGSDGGGSGAMAGDPYPCGRGEAGALGEGGALDCVVGQSFCYVRQGIPAQTSAGEGGAAGAPGLVGVPSCRDFAQEGPPQCAATPTCACLCRTFDCRLQCSCTESHGAATVTCGPV